MDMLKRCLAAACTPEDEKSKSSFVSWLLELSERMALTCLHLHRIGGTALQTLPGSTGLRAQVRS